MGSVLVLSGGSPHAHDFHESAGAFAELFREDGHDVAIVDHPDRAAARIRAEPPDALVVNGLHWRMLGDAYDRWRAEYGYTTAPPTRATIRGFVHGGGGLLANHTAPICFDDWPEWGDVVGGSWQWGVSSHPPAAPVTGRVIADHPVVSGLPSTLELDDEVYGDLDVRDSVDVLVVAKRTPDDTDQPVVWVHRYGDGKVVFDGFGHDVASITQQDHARLLTQGVRWVMETD